MASEVALFPGDDGFTIQFGAKFALHNTKNTKQLTMDPTTEASTAAGAPALGGSRLTVSRSESNDTAPGVAAPARLQLADVLASGIEEANSDDDRQLSEGSGDADEEMEDASASEREDHLSSDEEDDDAEVDDEDGEDEDDGIGPFPPPGPALPPLGPPQPLPPHMQALNMASPPQRPGVAGYGRLTSPMGSVIAMPNVPTPPGETLTSQTDDNLLEAGDSVRNMAPAQQHEVLVRCNNHINKLDGRASAQFQAMVPGDAATRQRREDQALTALRRAVSQADTTKWLTGPPVFDEDFGLYKYDMRFACMDTTTHFSDKKALAHGRLYETESAANYWSACFIRAYVEHGMDVATSRDIANATLRNMIAKKYGLVGTTVNHVFPN